MHLPKPIKRFAHIKWAALAAAILGTSKHTGKRTPLTDFASQPFFNTDYYAQLEAIRRTAETLDELAQACRKGVSESLGDQEAAVLDAAAKICRRKVATDEKRRIASEVRIGSYLGNFPGPDSVAEMAGTIYRVFALASWNATELGRGGDFGEASAARWLDRAMTPDPDEPRKPEHPIAFALERALLSEYSLLPESIARSTIKRADERSQTIAEAVDEVLAEIRQHEASVRQTYAALIERAIETLERERGAGSGA